EIAMKKGFNLNEYGLFKGKKTITGKTEEEIYKKLGLDYIEPEMRENEGEIELSSEHKLPKLIGYNDLQGDLQIQTNWTDGSNTIEEYAEVAIKKGLKYIVITDHTKRLAMTGGLDEKKLLKQIAEIGKINEKLSAKGYKFKILAGSEVDILKDGTLDLKDEALKKLDVCGAAIHSYFNLPKEEQTKRIIRAMENPHVDIIFHPTGRIINRRPAYEVDIDEIIKAAKRTNTVLEIDAFPDRLDLKDDYIRKCVFAGVKLAIDSDAHLVSHMDFLEFGIAQARRGWATKDDIINTRPVEAMLKLLKK
ncbi:MAG: PHP domain-containing protein, partial [Patescibacteria group bacterium]